MEAVPRMPMIGFELKISPESTSFGALKQYIAEYYQEDPESYSKECSLLEQLRGNAVRPTRDVEGTATIRRYFCQLHSIQNRFLLGGLSESQQMLTFNWKDLYSGATASKTSLKFEMACVLHNFAALHTLLGRAESRSDPEGMKKACTHFQCAAWAYGHVKDSFSALSLQGDLTAELLIFMHTLCLAQAQECIMEKSLCDNRKSGIIAKVTAQIISYYNSALAALLTQVGDGGRVQDIVGSKTFKEWRGYVRFKISYLSCILLLYQGQQAEEQQKMGERVALYQASFEKLEEARKEAKGLANQQQVDEALQFTMDVVEAKRKAAKNENEFIYHEEVPELSAISAVQGANLVNGIAFNVTDPEAMGEDIFHRLVPMKAHESSSLYSEEKATILRTIGARIEDRNTELETFMSSLNLSGLRQLEVSGAPNDSRLPQGLVDRCAELQAKPNAIPDLVQSMAMLADTCSEVELTLKEIKNLLRADEAKEDRYQQKIGQRSNGGAHIVELGRELAKYQEAHNKAGESNDTLRKAMGLHVQNLKILAQPLPDIRAQIPVCTEYYDENSFRELNAMLAKVEEMRSQREKLYQDLRHQITEDDITSQLIALDGGGSDQQKTKMEELFKKELAKHDQLVGLLEQNMKAQPNILKAMTEVYARCAPSLKGFSDTKTRRDQFFSSLQASYDVYQDLLSKSAKGLEFYRKLQSNVQKLYSRVKAACDVQNEERNQKLKSSNVSKRTNEINGGGVALAGGTATTTTTSSGGPKLKDYLKAGTITLGSIKAAGVDKHLPSIRPAPVGSESTSNAGGGAGISGSYYQDSYGAGYSNYTQQQQQQQPQQSYGGSSVPSASTAAAAGYDYSQYAASQQQPTTGYANPLYQNTNNAYYYQQQSQQQQQQPTANYDYGQYATPVAQQPSPAPSTASSSTDISQTPSWPQLSQQFSAMNLQPSTANNEQQAAYYGVASGSATTNTAGGYGATSDQQQQQQQYSNLQSQMNAYNALTQQQYPAASNPVAYVNYPQVSSSESLTSIPPVQDAYGNYNQTAAQYQQPATAQYYQQTQPQQQQQQGPYQSEQTTSYGSHPGYSYNSQTGTYEYTSGFQYDSSNASGSYQSQYSGNSHQTPAAVATPSQSVTSVDSSAQQYQISASPAIAGQSSGIQAGYTASATQQPPVADASSYYATNTNPTGYYHQSSTYSTIQSNQYSQQQVDPAQQPPNSAAHQQQQQQPQPTYDSGHVTHYSHHTNSYVDSTGSQQHQQPQQQPAATTTTTSSTSSQQPVQPTAQVAPQPVKPSTSSGNIDLLSGIDFSPANLPPITVPILQPQPSLPPSMVSGSVIDGNDGVTSEVLTPTKATKSVVPETSTVVREVSQEPTSTNTAVPLAAGTPSSVPFGDRKPSFDNLSLCSDLSSSFDWDSASVCGATATVTGGGSVTSALDNVFLRPVKPDPFEDGNTVKWFHKEVERLEKFVETINVKTLNGTTPLDSKWKELQDLLVKEESKRQVSVARLFPEKNRSIDCVPYDHARVQLSTDTDNYINAVYVKDLGFGCPNFVLAQTPLPNTVNDFWNMVWSQRANVIVCLHTANELLDPFWPTDTGKELSYGDVSVTLVKQFDLTHCTERTLRIQMLGSDYSLTVALLQPKLWPKNSAEHMLGVAQNLIDAYRQYNQPMEQKTAQLRPLVLNCLTGTDRSSLITIAIITILATQTRKPLLINVIDIWYRICCQRKGALRDPNFIQLSYQIVLSHGHSILNKRGILTSYQMKSAQAVSSTVKEETSNDPFKDLDPLWKLKG